MAKMSFMMITNKIKKLSTYLMFCEYKLFNCEIFGSFILSLSPMRIKKILKGLLALRATITFFYVNRLLLDFFLPHGYWVGFSLYPDIIYIIAQ